MQKTSAHVGFDAIIHTRAAVGSWIVVFASLVTASGQGQQESQAALLVRKCNDFAITGKGSDPEWTKAAWNQLTKLDDGGRPNDSKFKILYSATGIYVLFQGDDEKITTKPYKDFESIFNGDVFEVFFHTNPDAKVYFEYEVNHLGKELILTISNVNNKYLSWIPRNNEGVHRTGIQKLVEIAGGNNEIGSTISSWSAEIFFPYSGLGLLPDVPPSSGTQWNANFCRLDYDTGSMIKWSWTPSIEKSFHELDKFRSIKFE
jgi:hypothetical protein